MTSTLLKKKLVASIENLIIHGEYRDAIFQLRLLAIDYAPAKRLETSHLLSRLTDFKQTGDRG